MEDTKQKRECELCGHKGTDVEWQDNPYRSGWFCEDQEACFQRYKPTRKEEQQ